MRNRKEKVSDLADLSKATAAPTKKKPLGPRSSSLRSTQIPPPEEKSHFENALAAASASKGGFAQFPLVEDDLDSTIPRTPFHSPSQSPRSSSPLRPSPSLDAVASHFSAATKLKKEKTKAEINSELHVQDALLALRLKEFLRAQGVCEEDLRVDFDDEGKMVEPKEDHVIVLEKQPVVVQEEADEENNILDEYFMGIEEEESPATKKNKDRGPVVEDDDIIPPKLDAPFVEEDDLDMDMGTSSPPTPAPAPPPALQVSTMAQRISSPPPASPSPRPHAVLPTSYMVALLTMRVRHPSKKPGSSSSGSTSGNEAKTKVKRKSGLSVVVEVD